ncbi:MAG TPA: hypothetical protein PLI09_16260 [Candidatus Hydrogenedentes bacterium]|nr:hypothetical protein [Candidatus Hydrogenedentota bacterium]
MRTKIFWAARMAAAGVAAYMLAAWPHGLHKPALSPTIGLHANPADYARMESDANTSEKLEITLEEFCTAYANMQDEKFAQAVRNNAATIN